MRPDQQASASLGSRRFLHRPAQLGVEVDEELIAYALAAFELGLKFTTKSLAGEMGCSLAESIAVIGALRLRGAITNFGEFSYRLTPERKAA